MPGRSNFPPVDPIMRETLMLLCSRVHALQPPSRLSAADVWSDGTLDFHVVIAPHDPRRTLAKAVEPGATSPPPAAGPPERPPEPPDAADLELLEELDPDDLNILEALREGPLDGKETADRAELRWDSTFRRRVGPHGVLRGRRLVERAPGGGYAITARGLQILQLARRQANARAD